MSGMDGASSSARRNAWRKIHTRCVCGREIYGNGKAHQRTCEAHLEQRGWPVDNGMHEALMHEYGTNSVGILRAVELGLGRIYLERRRAGDKTEMRWAEFRDTFWKLADEAHRQIRT